MKNKLLFLILIILGVSNIKTHAQGDLLITPNRVVFKTRQIKEVLNLLNTGKETTTFSVSFVQRRMNEDGSFTIITETEEGQMFADPYLRIYPRRVTLMPGEAQVVMLQRRRRADMKPGEYRSHLYFRSEKNYSALGKEEKDEVQAFSVELTPIFGISIPIIIRAGDINATAEITDLKLENQQETKLTFTLNRKGNISIYGDFTVDYFPLEGESYTIGAMKGVAVYTNINKRFISIGLNKKPGLDLNKGILKIRYTSRAGDGPIELFAAKNLQLGI